MKYTFYKKGGVDMVSIAVDKDNVVHRKATEQDHKDAAAQEQVPEPKAKPKDPEPEVQEKPAKKR